MEDQLLQLLTKLVFILWHGMDQKQTKQEADNMNM